MTRRPAVSAIALACLTAAAAMLFLAFRQSEFVDEFWAIGHIRHAHFTGMWRSYRRSDDATPPLDYIVRWAIARVIGTSIVEVRLPSIVAWVVFTGSIGVFLRRLHPVAIYVGAVLPTTTALAALGTYARPYAFMLGCLGVALVAWQRTLDRPASRSAPIVLAVSLGLAATFHYTAAAATLAFAMAEVLARSASPGRSRHVLLMIGASLLPLLASVPLMRTEVHNHQAGHRVLDLASVPEFYASTVRPAALLALAVVGSIAWVLWRRRSNPKGQGLTSVLRPAETWLGVGLLCIVPPLAVGSMWATHSFYLHRYSAAALPGAAVLAGVLTDVVASATNSLAKLVLVAAVVSVPISVSRATLETPSRQQVHHLIEALQVPRDGTTVVFMAPYDFLYARSDRAGPRPPGWLLDGSYTQPGLDGAEVDLVELVQRSIDPVIVIGNPAYVREEMGDRHWRIRVLHVDHLTYGYERYSEDLLTVSRTGG